MFVQQQLLSQLRLHPQHHQLSPQTCTWWLFKCQIWVHYFKLHASPQAFHEAISVDNHTGCSGTNVWIVTMMYHHAFSLPVRHCYISTCVGPYNIIQKPALSCLQVLVLISEGQRSQRSPLLWQLQRVLWPIMSNCHGQGRYGKSNECPTCPQVIFLKKWRTLRQKQTIIYSVYIMRKLASLYVKYKW